MWKICKIFVVQAFAKEFAENPCFQSESLKKLGKIIRLKRQSQVFKNNTSKKLLPIPFPDQLAPIR
jgi:hypothetical protein